MKNRPAMIALAWRLQFVNLAAQQWCHSRRCHSSYQQQDEARSNSLRKLELGDLLDFPTILPGTVSSVVLVGSMCRHMPDVGVSPTMDRLCRIGDMGNCMCGTETNPPYCFSTSVIKGLKLKECLCV